MRKYPSYDEIITQMTAKRSRLFEAGKPEALRHFHAILPEVEHVPGLFAEVGTYKGTSAQFTAIMCPERTIHCYDTWAGMVGGKVDLGEYKPGTYSADIDVCRENLKDYRCVLHPGIFPETFCLWDEKFAFVYADTDTHFGTKTALCVFIPRMSKGGIIVVDDVDHAAAPLVRKAIEELGIKWEFDKSSGHGIIRL